MKVRIGIDVGGTFTDVVVIDNDTHELIGQLKLPTTHGAREGVALGIINALERAMCHFSLAPDDVSFIAHSTTQATNALLEGDVARVGVIGCGRGIESLLARQATKVPPIQLTASRELRSLHTFISAGTDQTAIAQAVDALSQQGAQVIVASAAFGVDDSELEETVAAQARAAGLQATSGHEVSSLYGLRVRTRTAVINAAILPKMIETAEMTERCVKSSGISAPLMIMRSDGGVVSVSEVHRRPILTMLSGPAAGIAGALMHERVSDGIFIEVGGTSADISVIRDGQPVTRPARLNGHRMYLNTLDVRTLGVGGGSMVRVDSVADNGFDHIFEITGVGARSAHIAGLGYACFTEPGELASGKIEVIQPAAGDERNYVVISTPGGRRVAITTTCAANFLGYISPEHFASGNRESAATAFELLNESLGRNGKGAEATARTVLDLACEKTAGTIEELIAEYHLARDQVVLVGGGGGAAALVPFTAEMMKLQHRIARNAEVISPIGVAMAMVRDTIERNLTDPTPDDILRVRREAAEAAIAAGAVAESIEVQVEVDKRRNLVRATAMGTTEMRLRRNGDGERQALGPEQCREIAARSMRIEPGAVRLAAETAGLLVFTGEQHSRSFFGLLNARREMLRVLDRTGVVRLQRGKARISVTTLAQLADELTRAVEQLTDYGDAGRTIPDVFILYGSRVANFSGLAELDQVIALAEVELRTLEPKVKLIVIACPKQV
ncbi:MAG TPA: hydantoinase/oxoprolinase family protein [Blastocatellia bacterium]|nr:hydantoinase/oxoprolinase family protein [Blastocatellia bacterium]